MKHNILLIDDDSSVRSSMKTFLEDEGFFVKAVETGDEGVALVRQKVVPFSLALVDYHMPGIKGPEVISKIREFDSKLHLLGFSCDDGIEAHNESLDSGALMFVAKDTGNEKLLGIIHRICREYEKKNKVLPAASPTENRKLIQSLRMEGASNHLADVSQLVLKYAPSYQSVLIRGENGTGKERIARALHDNSTCRLGPFIAVNCGAIPAELIESELFGHERGSFTGATKDRVGKFQAANGGTLFLDEIGELPIHLQATLLRVLQEGEITPVGSNVPKKVKVRVITATNAPLEEMIAGGRFRQDLFYRINALLITLEPLRNRPEDIPCLIEFFLKKENEVTGEQKEILSSCASLMMKQPWPGNIRELSHVISRMHLMTDGKVITEDAFERATTQMEPKTPKKKFAAEIDYEIWRLRTVSEEKQLVQRALNASKSLTEAADRLGIARSMLRSRMRALEIENPFEQKGSEQ
ncbi:MAG: sigma-54-dependent transcriptional regulator [Bdellovibrionales bacterium]